MTEKDCRLFTLNSLPSYILIFLSSKFTLSLNPSPERGKIFTILTSLLCLLASLHLNPSASLPPAELTVPPPRSSVITLFLISSLFVIFSYTASFNFLYYNKKVRLFQDGLFLYKKLLFLILILSEFSLHRMNEQRTLMQLLRISSLQSEQHF